MKKETWRKILYKDQGFPTNYTDESFLESMKKNGKLIQVIRNNYLFRLISFIVVLELKC